MCVSLSLSLPRARIMSKAASARLCSSATVFFFFQRVWSSRRPGEPKKTHSDVPSVEEKKKKAASVVPQRLSSDPRGHGANIIHLVRRRRGSVFCRGCVTLNKCVFSGEQRRTARPVIIIRSTAVDAHTSIHAHETLCARACVRARSSSGCAGC